MRNPCSKNVRENTIFCISLLLFQRILNAFLYDLYHQIAHILTFPCHNRYIYNTTNTNRVIKRFEVHQSTHRDPLSILKDRHQRLGRKFRCYVSIFDSMDTDKLFPKAIICIVYH